MNDAKLREYEELANGLRSCIAFPETEDVAKAFDLFECADAIDALVAEVRRVEGERRWIAVSDRLPATANNVLTVNTYGAIQTGAYSAECGWIGDDVLTESERNVGRKRRGFAPVYITHWMPLPDLPLAAGDAGEGK